MPLQKVCQKSTKNLYIQNLRQFSRAESVELGVPIFDRERIEAGFDIAFEATRQVSQFFASHAARQRALERRIDQELDREEPNDGVIHFLRERLKAERHWSASGKYGQILLVLSGAASANVTPEIQTFFQSAAIRYLHNQGIEGIAKFMDGLGYDRSTEGMRVVLQTLQGCAMSNSYSKHCIAGAVGGGLATIINSLLDHPDKCTAEQVEARRNLVASLVMGVARLTNQQVETATSIAMQETMLNWASGIAGGITVRVGGLGAARAANAIKADLVALIKKKGLNC